MTSRLVAVALDCRDPEALAAFWCAVLLFQPVHEDKAVKNRLHLDIAPVQGSQADEVTRLVGLGASVLDDGPTLPWVVLADPEDNEFCVLPPRS